MGSAWDSTFRTLRAITVLTLLAGLLNIPNFVYFNSDAYSPLESNFDSYLNDTVPNRLLQGSAICTDLSWVVCVDCDDVGSRYGYDNSRRAVGERVPDRWRQSATKPTAAPAA